MKKALAGVVVIAFIGLLFTSLFALFSGTVIGPQYTNQPINYAYLLAY